MSNCICTICGTTDETLFYKSVRSICIKDQLARKRANHKLNGQSNADRLGQLSIHNNNRLLLNAWDNSLQTVLTKIQTGD